MAAQVAVTPILRQPETRCAHQKPGTAQSSKHGAAVGHRESPFVNRCILAQYNLALRTDWFDRALVTKEFKNFVELSGVAESLTNR